MVAGLEVDNALLLGLRRSVRRMVTALPQLLVTVADRKSRGRPEVSYSGCPLLRGLWSVRRIVTLINTNTVTIMPASGLSLK